jgi:hypothetical protein
MQAHGAHALSQSGGKETLICIRVCANSDAKKGKSVTNKWYLEALRMIQQQHPWYNRSNGRDHVWPFPGARGPHIFQDWKKHIRRNIFLTPEGDRSLGEQFNTWKVRAHASFLESRRRTRGLNVVRSIGRCGVGALGMRRGHTRVKGGCCTLVSAVSMTPHIPSTFV